MADKKYCLFCGTLISDLNDPECNYYRHIRIKYCDNCRGMVEHFQASNRAYNFRQRRKEKEKFRDEQIELLREENAILRANIRQLREETEKKKF